MKLPERAGPLIEELRSFGSTEALRTFRKEAREQFGSQPEDEPEFEHEFEDYMLFTHRDAQGRSVVDQFLEDSSSRLDRQHRDAFERFEDSLFGFFRVEAVRPGKHVDLRRIGDNSEYRVVDTRVSRHVVVKSGLITRLLPFQEWYEFANPLLEYPPDAAYNLERSFRATGKQALDELTNPLQIYRILRELRKRNVPERAENRLEAEPLAGETFAEMGFMHSVEEVQARFRDLEGPLDFFRELGAAPFASEQHARRFSDTIIGLWNHTPRLELRGLTPDECAEQGRDTGHPQLPEHLAQDLMRTISAEIDPDSYPDDESRRAAMLVVQKEWFKTPQSELGGSAPDDILHDGEVPPLPPESALPEPDRPIDDPGFLESLLRDAARKPWAAAWALQRATDRGWIEAIDSELLRNSFLTLLDYDHENDWNSHFEDEHENLGGPIPLSFPGVAAKAIGAIIEAPEQVLANLAGDVQERLDNFNYATLCEALQFFIATSVRKYEEIFLNYLDSPDLLLQWTAKKGLGDCGHPRATAVLENLLAKNSTLSEKWILLSVLFRGGNVAALRRVLPSFVVPDSTGGQIALLTAQLHAVGVSGRICANTEWALFPLADEDETEHSHDDSEDGLDFRLNEILPRADPEAARRAEEVLPIALGRNLLRLVDAGNYRLAATSFFEAATGALQRLMPSQDSSRSNDDPATISMRRQAGTLATLLESVDDTHWRGKVSRPFHKRLLKLFTAILAWALRGRDIEAEWKEARSDPERIASLCRVDLDWLDRRRLELAAGQLSAEELAQLAQSQDEYVAESALAVLALCKPEDYLALAMGRAWEYRQLREIGAAAVLRHGDRALPSLVEWIRENDDDESREAFLAILATLGTKRASVVTRRTLESAFFHGGNPPYTTTGLTAVSELGDLKLMEYALERFESGAFDLESEAIRPIERFDCISEVATFFELVGRDEDPEIFVDAAIENFEANCEDVDDEDDEYLDSFDSDFTLATSEHESPFKKPQGETIRRESTKIGRNDPCPCGSDSKYKKCCGKNA